MSTEILLFGAIVIAAGFYFLGYSRRESEAETADKIAVANEREPLIFEQQFGTAENKLHTIEQAKKAVEALKLYGNKYIQPGIFPHGDVHLWIHDSDTVNRVADFAEWRFNNGMRRVRLLSEFRRVKNENAKTEAEILTAAKMWTTDELNEN
jgi:hypothetical protein